MKKCFRCGITKPLDAFYRHSKMADGHLNKCKDCTKAYVREHRVRNAERLSAYERQRSARPARKAAQKRLQYAYQVTNAKKYRARRLLLNAVKRGDICRQPCEVCGTTRRVEAHHDDYSRPLDIRWLCFKHHRELMHGQRVVADY